jgi:hypothetical protein
MIAWAIEGRPERTTPPKSATGGPAPDAQPELSSRVTTWVAWVFLASGVLVLVGAIAYRLRVGPTADVLLTKGGIALGLLLTLFGLGIAADRRVKDRDRKNDPNAKA